MPITTENAAPQTNQGMRYLCRMDATLDLSHYQSSVRFNDLAAAGIQLVIHKATEGTQGTDRSLMGREALCRAENIGWGTYHFLRPGNMEAQIQHYVQTVRPAPGSLCVLDAEVVDDRGRPALSAADLLRACVCLEQTTQAPTMIYATAGWLNQVEARGTALVDRPLWLARYPTILGKEVAAWSSDLKIGTIPAGWRPDQVLLWQYTSRGLVSGVSGPVDRSVGDLAPIWRLWPQSQSGCKRQ